MAFATEPVTVKKRGGFLGNLVSFVAFFVVPVALVVAVGAWSLADRADEMMAVGAAGALEEVLTDEEAPSEEELLSLWLDKADASEVSEASHAELLEAFKMIQESPAFEREFIAGAARVGQAWNSGESVLWSIDLRPALGELSADLPPGIAEIIATQPTFNLDWFDNPGFHRLGDIAPWAALTAAALLLLQLALTMSPRSVSQSLWVLMPLAAVILIGMTWASRSSSPPVIALGDWLNGRLRMPMIVLLAVGFLAWLVPRTRARSVGLDSVTLGPTVDSVGASS